MKTLLTLSPAIILLAAPLAHAIPVFDIAAGTSDSQIWAGDDLTLGYDFIVDSSGSLTFDALAVFNKGGLGLNSAHEVGVWGSSGLITSVTVGVGDPTAPSASEHGEWVYHATDTPITLGPGAYTVGAFYGADNLDQVMYRQTVINNASPPATYVHGQYIYSSTFELPTEGPYTRNEPQYFGPTLLSGTQRVPSGGATALLFALAVGGLQTVRNKLR